MMQYLLLIAALFIGSANAFVPTTPRQTVISAEQSATSLGPGFLKDLGFEKPSWLPDFGDSKAEAEVAPAAAEVTEEEGEGDEGEEAAIEE